MCTVYFQDTAQTGGSIPIYIYVYVHIQTQWGDHSLSWNDTWEATEVASGEAVWVARMGEPCMVCSFAPFGILKCVTGLLKQNFNEKLPISPGRCSV